MKLAEASLFSIFAIFLFCEKSAASGILVRLPKNEVPTKVESCSIFYPSLENQKFEVNADTIQYFLDHGKWTDVWTPAGRNAMVKNPPDKNETDSLSAEEIKESEKRVESPTEGREAKAKAEYEENWGRFDLRPHRATGAFTAPDGQILLWYIQSRRKLWIECVQSNSRPRSDERYGEIWIILPKEKALELSPKIKREIPKFRLPKSDEIGKRTYRDEVDHSYRFATLPKESIAEFLLHGKPVSDSEETTKQNKAVRRDVTTRWVPDLHFSDYRDFEWTDLTGRPLLNLEMNRREIPVRSLFFGADKKLWRSRLLSDAHLEITDPFGRITVLEHPEAIEKKMGIPNSNFLR